MVTTIQINEQAKQQLDKLKLGRQTYEEIILNLIKQVEKQKRSKKELLIEGCNVMAEENLKITKEFEAVEDLSKWEW